MLDFVTNRRILVGEGALQELPDVLSWYRKSKVFLSVFDRNAACVKKVTELLGKAGFEFVLYDKIVSEPDLDVVDQGASLCKGSGCDAVVAIGGGSVIDTSKTISMLATNGGCTEDYQLNGKAVTQIPLLFVAVPTTAGTGAEATKVSVIYNAKKGFKKALYHNSMIAEVAILDPETTVGLPGRVTAATGMDAITHAVESYVSNNANVISRMYSLKALKLLADNIRTAYREPGNLEARANMLLGSYFAGCAISAGTTLAHIVGQPLGAVYHIPHGDSCTIFLIPSMKLNLKYCTQGYCDVAKVLGVNPSGKTDEELALAGIDVLDRIRRDIGAPVSLTPYVSRGKFDMEMMLDNIQTSMGHIKTNPRPVNRELFRELIEQCF
ncbi:iron-containing alcohol dehydrogenase [Caproiciproducens sp. NJN-50]|uniref:iron-containing alcohol dehydrogenase n=1 Tax=Acutalibacteraceae TaxID=3082771 RepID=UPI000FFE0CB3|nr:MULTISPECIES: iron-containing alcohol dehydrogenase [Acutalibacteraceae]QAT49131.1 iron-containing alcohol dehydrogenase [Caproiciproducens sp. NJN-50]